MQKQRQEEILNILSAGFSKKVLKKAENLIKEFTK